MTERYNDELKHDWTEWKDPSSNLKKGCSMLILWWAHDRLRDTVHWEIKKKTWTNSSNEQTDQMECWINSSAKTIRVITYSPTCCFKPIFLYQLIDKKT